MSTYIDADAVIKWERGDFDLPAWMEDRPDELVAFPATVWQQLCFGIYAWESARATRRARSLELLGTVPVVPFARVHAIRAAQLAAELRRHEIGFADLQIAGTALADGAQLLSFNREHFARVAGLVLATT